MKLIVRLLPPGLKARSILLFVIAAAGAYLASLVPIYLGRTLDEFTAAGVTLYSIGAFSAMFLLSGVLDIYRRAA
ncbi:MAG: hypothetical protein LBS19_15650, partial [Clostridiales bacterium]|nr:hypothetical protein [Clostridiales bacterium]